ncbi:MAG: 6-bladed beta-propeller [Chitinophagaceae bacterium]
MVYLKQACISLSILLWALWTYAQSNQTAIRIDPTYAIGGKASQIFDEVSFMPLETTRESTFGILQDIQVSSNYITFFDVSTNAIFIFDKKGRLHGKITELPSLNKEAADHFSALRYFRMRQESENIYIVYDVHNDAHTRHLAVFSPDGKLLSEKTLNSSFNRLSVCFTFLDSAMALFASDRKDPHSNYYFYKVNNFDTVISNIMPVTEDDPLSFSWTNSYALMSTSLNGSIWSRMYDYSAYCFDKKGLPTSYKVLLPASLALLPEFYIDSSVLGNKKRCLEYLSGHRDRVSYLTDLYKIKQILAFHFVKYNMASPYDSYLYSLTSGKLYSVGRIGADSLCYFLPIFTLGSVVGTEDDYIYVSVPSFVLFNTMEDFPHKEWQSDPALKEYFTTQNRKSNPILVRLKLKNNL